MQVFKAFFKIVNRHKSSLFVYLGIFFALTLVLSGAGGSEKSKNDFSQVSISIGLENKDKGVLGEALREYLSEQNTIKKIPKEREKLLDAIYYQEVEYVLVIPEDFTEKFLQGEREEVLEGTAVPGSSTSFFTKTEISRFLGIIGMYIDSGYEAGAAASQALSDIQEESRVEFLHQEDAQKRPAASYYFQYMCYIFLCVMVIGLGQVLMAFNKKDMDARNKCSSVSFLKRNLQMISGSIGLMLIGYALFMIPTFFIYSDYMWSVRGFLSATNALVYMLLCLSVAFLAGRLTRNTGELNMIANVAGLALSFLGGVFVPLELMSESVKKVSKFVPSYWYIISNEKIWKIKSLAEAGEIFKNCLVIVVFSVAILSVTMLVNRMKARTA